MPAAATDPPRCGWLLEDPKMNERQRGSFPSAARLLRCVTFAGAYGLLAATLIVTPSLSQRAMADSGPVRMARFSVVEGGVSWRPDARTKWAEASINLPV